MRRGRVGGNLWAWEEELVRECSLLLSYVHLQEDTVDLWQCKLDRSGVYFFRCVYQLLTSHQGLISYVDPKLVWCKKVLLKVFVFALR